jgi:hypothetical protein
VAIQLYSRMTRKQTGSEWKLSRRLQADNVTNLFPVLSSVVARYRTGDSASVSHCTLFTKCFSRVNSRRRTSCYISKRYKVTPLNMPDKAHEKCPVKVNKPERIKPNFEVSFDGIEVRINTNCQRYNGMEHLQFKVIKTPWSESARELYRSSDRRLSAK